MTRRQQFRILARALGSSGRRRLTLLALLTVVGGIAEFASLIALLNLLRSWLSPGSQALSGQAAGLFAVAVIAAGAIRMALLAATQRLAFDTGHRLLVAVQRRVLARDWLDHVSSRASGPLAAVEQVDQIIYGLLLPLLQGGTALVLGGAILAALIRIDAPLAFGAALLLGGLFLLASLLFRPALRRSGTALNEGHEERIATIQGHVGALRELILAGSRGAAAERFRRIDAELAKARSDIAVALGGPRILVESLGLLALTALAWWLAGRSGGIGAALPALAALALGAQRLLPLVQTLAQALSGVSANAPALERLSVLLDAPDLNDAPPPSPLPFARELRLEGVRFTYPGRRRAALDGIDLTLRKGEQLALCGRNGSGKSSLADVVMGLILPQEGRLMVDGRALATGDLMAWQRNIAHVPQSPFLVDGSIAQNIGFADEQPDHVRIVEAARLAGLHELIQSLPRGYETRIGERGLLLSGGQRQRLALARALYAPAPLLVLDEATSALDPETEAHVRQALDALRTRGVTILLIAHRTTLLDGCDRVVHLSEGRIAG